MKNHFQISPKVVKNVAPFSKALKESYELAIDSKKNWTVMIDADLLPSPQLVVKFINKIINRYTDSFFEGRAYVIDKFFGGPRSAGFRIYKTNLLKKAIKEIPSESVSLRPETYTIKAMLKQGYQSSEKKDVVGLHDFEQFYEDIFRKGIAHFHKHHRYIRIFEKCWKQESQSDEDFKILLLAISFAQNVRAEDAFNKNLINDFLDKNGIKLTEKDSSFFITEEELNNKIKSFKTKKCYKKFKRIQKVNKIKQFFSR
ncbi:MAG: hypothetical protein KatS3mg085_067 [Candidatus Dojkabacteria bacterium]|nr:MAG: hypothetical protein KatS3mg085_067 [Candidatus Dojkabacteria bacterium]